MSKFIEVDKLLVEIEKWRDRAKEKYNESTYSMGRCDALAEFRNHIVSIQQEPRFPQYNNIVEKVFGAGNIEGFEYREAEMLVALAKEELLKSLQQEQLDHSECVWIHKKYNRAYRIVSDNARLKNSNGEWIDCVIYAPLYENEFEMFAREKNSFYSEFEKVK